MGLFKKILLKQLHKNIDINVRVFVAHPTKQASMA